MIEGSFSDKISKGITHLGQDHEQVWLELSKRRKYLLLHMLNYELLCCTYLEAHYMHIIYIT